MRREKVGDMIRITFKALLGFWIAARRENEHVNER